MYAPNSFYSSYDANASRDQTNSQSPSSPLYQAPLLHDVPLTTQRKKKKSWIARRRLQFNRYKKTLHDVWNVLCLNVDFERRRFYKWRCATIKKWTMRHAKKIEPSSSNIPTLSFERTHWRRICNVCHIIYTLCKICLVVSCVFGILFFLYVDYTRVQHEYHQPLMHDYTDEDYAQNAHRSTMLALEDYLDRHPDEMCASALDVLLPYHHVVLRLNDTSQKQSQLAQKKERVLPYDFLLHAHDDVKRKFRHLLNPRVYMENTTINGHDLSHLDHVHLNETNTFCQYVYKFRPHWLQARWSSITGATYVPKNGWEWVFPVHETKRTLFVRAEYELISRYGRINESFFAEHAICLQHYADVFQNIWTC